MSSPTVLHLDNHLLVVTKPAGWPVQPDDSKDWSMLDWARQFIKETYAKPGNVFVGLVHRLDRPVSGVMVLARTSKAAARLSEQFSQRTTRKVYRALAEGRTPESANLVNWMRRHQQTSHIATSEHSEGAAPAKPAELSYRRLDFSAEVSHLEVELKTGRHHQIRAQLAHHGHPLLGDRRYGSKIAFPQVGLHAYSLTFAHPTQPETLTFTAEPPGCWLFK